MQPARLRLLLILNETKSRHLRDVADHAMLATSDAAEKHDDAAHSSASCLHTQLKQIEVEFVVTVARCAIWRGAA
jgi:hypothetical protein